MSAKTKVTWWMTLWTVGAVAGSLVLFWWLMRASPNTQLPTEDGTRSTPTADAVVGGKLDVEINSADTGLKAQLMAAKSQQAALLMEAKRIEGIIEEWEREVELWAALKALQTNEAGRRIASDEILVRFYQGASTVAKEDERKLVGLREGMLKLIAPVKQAHINPKNAYIPDAVLTSELTKVETQATVGRDTWQEARLRVESVVKLGTSKPISKKTLGEAIAEAKALKDLKALQTITESQEKAQKEAAQEKAKVEAEIIRKRETAALAKFKAAEEAKAAEIRRATEKLKAEREAADAEAARVTKMKEAAGKYLSKVPMKLQHDDRIQWEQRATTYFDRDWDAFLRADRECSKEYGVRLYPLWQMRSNGWKE